MNDTIIEKDEQIKDATSKNYIANNSIKELNVKIDELQNIIDLSKSNESSLSKDLLLSKEKLSKDELIYKETINSLEKEKENFLSNIKQLKTEKESLMVCF